MAANNELKELLDDTVNMLVEVKSWATTAIEDFDKIRKKEAFDVGYNQACKDFLEIFDKALEKNINKYGEFNKEKKND